MTFKQFFKKDQKFNDWTLINYLGGGGNGEVWSCKNSSGQISAIKLLKNIKNKSYARFIDETNTIESNSDIDGIILIHEKYLPEKLGGPIPYYIMPLAKTSRHMLLGRTLNEKVDAIIQIAETLSKLHERKIYHRDIKPDNILYFNSRYCIADFGLVDFPNKIEISVKNEVIGPKWTMAPEMKRESSTADSSKADIYSLAKTLWILLTDRTKGFDGQYSIESIIELKKYFSNEYTSPIDELLISATDNDPEKRPTIYEFIHKLKEWKRLSSSFHNRNIQQWFEIQSKLFPASIPKRVIWENINDIVNVLKLICTYHSLNHVFFPKSGGLDLKDARLAYESNCIELDFQSIYIIRPKRLIFESFTEDQQWNYFRIETNILEPTSFQYYEEELIYQDKEREIVSELSPGEYYPYEILNDKRTYEEDYLFTDFSRHVTRIFGGSFVVFCKRSSYNLIRSTYDGRHNKMTTDGFREYIQLLIDEIEKQKNRDLSIDNLFNIEKPTPNRERIKHFIEEETVYRCGWCGDIVDYDGSELERHLIKYNWKVIEKFGDSVVKQVDGYCCKHKKY